MEKEKSDTTQRPTTPEEDEGGGQWVLRLPNYSAERLPNYCQDTLAGETDKATRIHTGEGRLKWRRAGQGYSRRGAGELSSGLCTLRKGTKAPQIRRRVLAEEQVASVTQPGKPTES